MENSQSSKLVSETIVIPVDLANKAKQEDERVVNSFNSRIVDLSARFNEREVATMCRVSVEYVTKLKKKLNLTFADAKARTKAEQAAISKEFKKHRAATIVRQVEKFSPLKPDQIQVNAKLQAAGRKGLWDRNRRFYLLVLEHSKTMSFKETYKIVGVTPRFLRNFCYENDIEFAGYSNQSVAGLDLFDIEGATNTTIQVKHDYPTLPWQSFGKPGKTARPQLGQAN